MLILMSKSNLCVIRFMPQLGTKLEHWGEGGLILLNWKEFITYNFKMFMDSTQGKAIVWRGSSLVVSGLHLGFCGYCGPPGVTGSFSSRRFRVKCEVIFWPRPWFSWSYFISVVKFWKGSYSFIVWWTLSCHSCPHGHLKTSTNRCMLSNKMKISKW